MTATAQTGSFPSPYAVTAPEGCEGWEEMYPYYALFDERRRDSDENRFWFWNSMHFPTPHPAFDVICIDSPYQAVGAWQNRVFAVPPAMGIDYRVVNGYVYISGNPVTDPDKIAERAGYFQRRAGHYYENWPELYGKWKAKMEALIAELVDLEVPELPEYEPEEIAFSEGRNTACYEVLEAYGRCLRLGDLMWQHHFEFLLLGYGAYATFAELCKTNLPDIPDQHIAQMVAGIDVLLFKPDAELRRLARLALEAGIEATFAQGRTPEEIEGELAQTDAGRDWLAELEKIKDPWFNMATGDGLTHYYRSWLDDPSIPYASIIGHVNAIRAGEQVERPTEEIERERERLAQEYGALLPDEVRGPWRDLLALSRTVFPYVEEHKFYCDYWFLTRWWNKVREFGALLAAHDFLEDPEDIFQLSRHEVATALDELVLTWATGGVPLGPKHWPPIAARRRELLERLAQWTPPPALGVEPDEITDPMTIMLWGVTTDRVKEWARQREGGSSLNGAAASPGIAEGVARVVRSVSEIADVREGEILVCGSTSPAWAPIFAKIKATVTDVGGVMSHSAIVCREYGLPAVVGTGRATSQIRTGQMIRVDGSAGVVTLMGRRDGPHPEA
ncbi:MAG TPA: PEP-utilizing enzyme [Solirubrobacteraceae bacterium]|jgi:pyruvate,water dikinase|nr:PEP-utilizing enzyme [Solirubrobacteraceae bacterium]